MAKVNDADRHTLCLQRDRHRRDHEGRLHLVGDQRLFDFREALKHPRNKNVVGLSAAADVVGYRTGQVTCHRDEGHVELALILRQTVVDHYRPVEVQAHVERRDPSGPQEQPQQDTL